MMMKSINIVISNIINRKDDICGLCLDYIREDITHLNEAVIIHVNNEDVSFRNMISSVFDKEMLIYLSYFNSICEECTKQVISNYKFIQTCRKNAKYFINIVDGINRSLDYTVNDVNSIKSVFVPFNPQDFSSKHHYEIKTVFSSINALKRLNVLDKFKKLETIMNNKSIQTTNFIETDEEKLDKEKECSTNTIPILITQMLQDQNNSNFECTHCYKNFTTSKSLKRHIYRMHTLRNLKCPDCIQTFTSIKLLEKHRNECHYNFVCSDCGRKFYNKHTYNLHEFHHKLTIVCEDCGRVYKNKATFRNHIKFNVCGQECRANAADGKYTCDHCNKKYTQKTALKVHIQCQHQNYKAHVCDWCGKKYSSNSRLTAHIVTHTKEKKFSCPICRGKFVSKESLRYHIRTHTGEKPYKCFHCDFRFLSASRRTEHIKRQHIGGTYECNVCHSKFNSERFLIKHEQSHTNG